MTADIVNLNKARKQKARADKEARAAENRVRFGRTKAERAATTAERARTDKSIDGARRTGATAARDEDKGGDGA